LMRDQKTHLGSNRYGDGPFRPKRSFHFIMLTLKLTDINGHNLSVSAVLYFLSFEATRHN
jgi:hypothetical protein